MDKLVQDFSLHTHTVGFDGANSPSDMVMCAKNMGFTSFGISNHFIVHPDIKRARFYPVAESRGYDTIYSTTFDEVIKRFQLHYAEFDRVASKWKMRLFRGMEVDFFDTPEWMCGFERALKILKPDYIIGASHFVEYGGILCNVHDMANADDENRDKMVELYWAKVARVADSGMFNWMAHLDLPKKTGCGRDACWADVEQTAIDAIAKSKTPIEINTSLYRPNCDEPYPSPRILRMAAVAKIPVLLSDDAHAAKQIGRNFARAYDLAKSCGVTHFLSCAEAIRSR